MLKKWKTLSGKQKINLMDDMKLTTVYLTKSQDDEIKALAFRLSTPECKITVSDVIRAAIASALAKFYYIDKDILKAYFELKIDLDVLTELDPETIKNLLAIMK